jgi:hypothetical protein
VYEIYKVGEDAHWATGLGIFSRYGLTVAAVTHWDNTDGGAAIDTSRAYVGQARFDELVALLPDGVVVVGIDEHTALAIDPAAASATVLGRGGVTIVRDARSERHATGDRIDIDALGPFAPPPAGAVSTELAAAIRAARREAAPQVPPDVGALVAAREKARHERDWATADGLRRTITEMGWSIEDTPDGPRVRSG